MDFIMSISENRQIILQPPYSEIYEYGYKYTHSIGQYDIPKIRLKNKNGQYETINFSRYVLGVHLGRILEDNERVMHKDNNPLNNDVSNLVIKLLNPKPPLKEKKEYTEQECEFCHHIFIKHPLKQNNFCSPLCKTNHLKKKKIEFENKVKTKKLIHRTKIQRSFNECNLKNRTPIQIERPYKSIYEAGFLRQEKNKLILYLKGINETVYAHSMLYERYLLGVKINKILTRSDRVVFLDGNSCNLSLNNLVLKERKQ